nr:choice-of-anchor J domain-containing protein [Bacteroidales bacterium]
MKKVLRFLTLAALLCIPWVTQAQQALPYSYGFEDNNLSADGWTGPTSHGEISANASKTGSYGFCFEYYTSDIYLMSPILTGGTNGVVVSFWYKAYNSSYPDHFKVGYTTDVNVTDPSAFTYGSLITSSDSWQQYEETFPAGTVRIAILYDEDNYNDGWYLYLDDFTFEIPPACPVPTALTATNLTTSSATLGWTSGASNFNVRYRTALIENHFFYYDFESGLTGWTIYTDGEAPQTDGWYTVNPTSGLSFDAHSGSYCASAWSWSSSSYDADNWLVSPEVPLTGTLRFYVRTNQEYPDEYEVLLSTTGTDEADFTVTLQAMAAAPTTGAWEEVSIDLSSYSGNGYIAIHHVSNDMNYLLIDDFGIYGTPTPAGDWVNTTSATTSKAISGLTEETTYDFEVQANCGGDGMSEWASSTFTTNPSCMPVADLAVSAATTTTITLTWTDQNSGAASYIVTDGNDDPVTVTNLTVSGCTVTGLTANTAYTFKVTASCGSTEETINTRTACDAIAALPYEEGFEGDGLYCWTLDGFNGLNNNTYSHDGNRSIYSQEDLAYAILPATATNISGLMLNFWWTNKYSGYDFGSLQVGYITDVADYTTFVSVGTIDMSSSSSSADYVLSDDYFFTGAPAGARIALKYIEGDYAQVFIDDVTIDNVPSCLKPTDLTASALTATTATLSWTANSGESAWVLQYGTNNTFADNTTEVGVSTTPSKAVTGLTANTTYYARVKADCGGGSESDWSTTYSFTTPCAAVTVFPWSENFESATANTVPNCWDNSGSGSSTLSSSSSYYIWGVYSYSDNKMIRMCNYWVQSGTTLINTPPIELPSASYYQLTFDYAHNASCGDFTVKVSTNGGSSFADLQSYSKGSGSAYDAPGDFTEATISLAAYAGETIILQFFANATYGSGAIFIDNIRVGEAPTCFKPTGLAATPTTTTAELSWTANSGESEWTVYYKTAAAADYTEVTNVPNNPYTLTGLTAATTYMYYVKANCSGSDVSDASDVYNFNTQCNPVTDFPWSENFESYATGDFAATCWTNEHITGSGTYIFKVYSGTNGTNATKQLQLPDMYSGTQTKLVLPGMDLPNDHFAFSLDVYRSATGSSSTTEGVRVYASTDGEITGATELAFISRNYTVTDDNLIPAEAATGWYTYTLPIGFDGTCYIILRGESQYGSATYMDNFLVTACQTPTALAYSNRKHNQVTLTWTSNAGAWDVCVDGDEGHPIEVTDHDVTIEGTTITYVLTGLNEQTDYTVKVRNNCGGSDGVSLWSNEVAFQTLRECATPENVTASNIDNESAVLTWEGTAPFYVKYREAAGVDPVLSEGFESGNGSWTLVNCAGSTGASTNDKHSGSSAFRFYYSSNPPQYLVSPELNGIVAGATLEFYYKNASSTWNETFHVGTSTTAAADAAEIEANFSFGAEITASDQQWHLYSATIPAGTKYVCIKLTSDDQFYLYIDDILIGNPTAAGEWEYYDGQADLGDADAIDDNTVTLRGLRADTKYEVVVIPDCETSLESDPCFFTTISDPVGLTLAPNVWHAIASPMHTVGQTYEAFTDVDNLTTGTYDLLRWYEYDAKWQSQKEGANHTHFENMERGRGYIFRYSGSNRNVIFHGQVNTGAISFNASSSSYSSNGDLKGFNLIGNPYSTACSITNDFYELQGNGMWTVSADHTLDVFQAVMVKVASTTAIPFTPGSTKGVKGSAETNLVFSVSNGEYTDIAYARFNGGESLPKFGHLTEEAPMLSIAQDEHQYAIAVIADD